VTYTDEQLDILLTIMTYRGRLSVQETRNLIDQAREANRLAA